MKSKATDTFTFITVPRHVASDYRNGIISRQERDLLCWLRCSANPFGIAPITLESIAEDCFPRGVTLNYVNRILLSLKRKRYIYYEPRSGCRGSFEVHMDEWPLPREDKTRPVQIRRLDKLFEGNTEVRDEKRDEVANESEADVVLASQSQRFGELKKGVKSLSSKLSMDNVFRGSDTDTDTEKEKEFNTKRKNSNEDRDLTFEAVVRRFSGKFTGDVIVKAFMEAQRGGIKGAHLFIGDALVPYLEKAAAELGV